MNNNEFVTKWAIDTIKEKFANDIALVLSSTAFNINEEEAFSFYVPATERGNEFSNTFILNGEGFDIWSVSWDRLEQFANLNEYNICCLADSKIIYARNDEDVKRFNQLKQKQFQMLSNPQVMRVNTLEAYAQAKKIYLSMLFSKGSDVKIGAAYVVDYLARAIAFHNHTYFKKSQIDQVNELQAMQYIPQDFIKLYNQVIMQKDEEAQKKLCYQLICIVQDFLEIPQTKPATEYNFNDLAEWYCELSYTWLRIRHYSKAGDITKSFMWGAMLQEELNRVCEDFGLEKFSLMEHFDPQNLSLLAEYANKIEIEVRNILTDNDAKINEYASTEDFINEV